MPSNKSRILSLNISQTASVAQIFIEVLHQYCVQYNWRGSSLMLLLLILVIPVTPFCFCLFLVSRVGFFSLLIFLQFTCWLFHARYIQRFVLISQNKSQFFRYHLRYFLQLISAKVCLLLKKIWLVTSDSLTQIKKHTKTVSVQKVLV